MIVRSVHAFVVLLSLLLTTGGYADAQERVGSDISRGSVVRADTNLAVRWAADSLPSPPPDPALRRRIDKWFTSIGAVGGVTWVLVDPAIKRGALYPWLQVPAGFFLGALFGHVLGGAVAAVLR